MYFRFYLTKYILLCAFVAVHVCAQDKDSHSPVTVDKVDLQRYSGLWYEIAKIPNSFQDQCEYGTTAEYIIDEDWDLVVINKCYEEDGKLDVAEGVTNVVDKETNSKLEVSFVSFFGIRPFWGDYWIIGLDDNYNYAIIGHPERKYGWVLSRSTSLEPKTEEEIIKLLELQGYNWNDFELTKHKK